MTESWLAGVAVGALLLSGCAGSGDALPPVVREARERADDGHDAFAEGRLDEATLSYGEALTRYRSIDDPVGIVRTLVNLAVVRNAADARSEAADCLDAIDRYVATLPAEDIEGEMQELLAEAAWMRAYLHLEAGRPAAASEALGRGRTLSPPRNLRGRFDNLEARLLLEQGRAGEARIVAERARRANGGSGDRAELADSHRLLGRAALVVGDAAAAFGAFDEALALDRELARPAKVAADLKGLAEASRLMGDSARSAAFAERARLAKGAGTD